MPTTLRDIAARLNLSPTLVSRVLNERPGVWASEETRRRIFAAAREMNYRPSASARALSTGRTMQLAVSAADADLHSGMTGRLLEVLGLIEAATPHQYRVLVLPSPAHHADRREFEALIHSGGCDGFCVYAEQADAGLYALLREHAMPFVVVGNPDDPTLPQVDHDNFQYAYDSVAWLSRQGHGRIGFVDFTSPTNQPYISVLRRGYAAATEALCGGFDPILAPGDLAGDAERIAFACGPAAPTALIVRELYNALAWKRALHAAGLRVPEDMPLLTHLRTSEQMYLDPAIVGHIHDPRAVGARAGETLIRWIQSGAAPDPGPILVPTGGVEG